MIDSPASVHPVASVGNPRTRGRQRQAVGESRREPDAIYFGDSPPRSLSAWSGVHNQDVVSEKTTPPRNLPPWSGVRNQNVVSEKTTPPRSLPAWSGVSSGFSVKCLNIVPRG